MNTFFPMTRVLDAAFNPYSPKWQDSDVRTTVTPRADILEGEREFKIMIDLPGVAMSDLDISVEDQTLAVKAGRRNEVPEGFELRRHERYGQVDYVRTFNLGNTIDQGSISARFKEGVLEITLPKSERSVARRIEVQ
jgi:HSP20 family protein